MVGLETRVKHLLDAAHRSGIRMRVDQWETRNRAEVHCTRQHNLQLDFFSFMSKNLLLD